MAYQQRTASGLFIPEKSQETLNEGVVIAAGPGAFDKVSFPLGFSSGLVTMINSGARLFSFVGRKSGSRRLQSR